MGQVWDVLSNKEAIDIVASAPGRGTASRALVDCATRAWRLKYPTSKNDDCAAVCLFLDALKSQKDVSYVPEEENEKKVTEEETKKPLSSEVGPESDDVASLADSVLPLRKECNEIEAVVEEVEEKSSDQTSVGQSKRSLAECLSTAEDEDWSALEGITRVNSLLSLPRFLPFDKRSTSWRKWL